MKRPAFQFYPADWRNNSKLRRCSEAARGAWMDVICVLHDSDEYGVCRWPLTDLARAAGVAMKSIKELVDKDVLKGGDKGCEPYVYTPRSGGKDGESVVLVESSDNKPCWYCSRLVRDEYVRKHRGQSSRFDHDKQPPKGGIGGRHGDGSTSSSTSSSPGVIEGAGNTEKKMGELHAGEVCRQLVLLGVSGVNPGHPLLLTLLQAGAAMDEFTGAASEAVSKKKTGFAYVLGMVKGRREEAKTAAETIKTGSISNSKPWFISASGIEAKVAELKFDTHGELMAQYKPRLFMQAGITQDMVRQAQADFA